MVGQKPPEELQISHVCTGNVLLRRERGNHRILEARLTQRNDTGLGFYLKGTQEQNLTVKKSDVSIDIYLLTADENRKLRIHENCHAVQDGLCRAWYVRKLRV